MKKKYSFLLILLLSLLNVYAQYNYRSPLDIPLSLSANFGELRSNHFHTGIDLKTDGVVNKNVYSIEDGYVSRIGVNAGEYGLVLYVDHPNGHTSVYAHLNSFSSKIGEYVEQEQYKQERYALNIRDIEPNELPVKKGELIAKSGNTGGSGGPHVHFELRDTKSQTTIDPLPYFIDKIEDTALPEVRGIAIFAIDGEGVVNGSLNPFRENITPQRNGNYPTLKTSIEAWGKIGIAINSVDRMNGTTNIYGVKEVRLFCNGNEIFSSDINSIDFATTRMINSFVDYDYWRHNKRFYMKSFIEPGNKLHIYNDNKKGYINIDEEKTYNLHYELKDVYGNMATYNFSIEGRRREIPKQEACSLVMHWDKDNRYISDHFYLNIPKAYLYKNVNFVLNREPSTKYYSQIYHVHNNAEPLNDYVPMSLQLASDPLPNKEQYGIVLLDQNGKENWIGGVYDDGYVTAQIRELGQTYAIYADTQSPSITPVAEKNWQKNGKIVIKLIDNLSGIKIFNGSIDGKYALFRHDIKSPNYTYSFDPERLIKGTHKLEFTATDEAGNISVYSCSFNY